MKVHEIARTYLGEQELPKNSGFKNEVFASKMIDVGFQKGQAWCSYFAELCTVEALPTKRMQLSSIFDASAVKTFNNFKKAGYKAHLIPEPGMIAFWQTFNNGVADWTGHTGPVSDVIITASATMFKCIEGNTNDKGGREGYIVAERPHHLTFDVPPEGRHLVLLGFINPDEL